MSHHHDDDLANPYVPGENSLETILEKMLNRRQILSGGATVAATTVIGMGLAGCDGNDNPTTTGPVVQPTPAPGLKLGFVGVPKSLEDKVTVPPGYTATVLYRTGDPLNAATPVYANNGSESGDSFDFRAGEHHDGLYFFGVGSNGRFDPSVSDRGLLVMNHENISGGSQVFMHQNGPTTSSGTRTVADEVVKEINMHGVSVVEVNRSANENTALTRYGIAEGAAGNYNWTTATVPSGKPADYLSRWNITKASGAAATSDFQNVANTFGWVVEIDPFSTTSTPAKRTALGRMAHEGAWPGPVVAGKPVVFYMGDDSRGEYLYKFVSDALWNAADANGGLAAGAKYLNAGKLYAAKFTTNGAGEWLLLSKASIPAAYTAYTFADDADVLLHSRLAGDAVGATKMDRPEWTAVNTTNGEVYLTLTNNNAAGRPVTGTNFANPRSYNDPKGTTAQRGNPNGHIIRLREAGDDPAATTFSWDIYLFAARASADAANVNLSGLTAANDLSSPDGLWFSKSGLLWIETDDGAYTDVTNCMLLAAIPGRVSDGTKPTITNTDGTTTATQVTSVGKKVDETTLLRFLVGPAGCELTGLTESPDGKALFVNIQHPGEDTTAANVNTPANYQSGWPYGTDAQATPTSPKPRALGDGGHHPQRRRSRRQPLSSGFSSQLAATSRPASAGLSFGSLVPPRRAFLLGAGLASSGSPDDRRGGFAPSTKKPARVRA